jgi:glutamate-ammonia-ligase adenylyltransferase
MPLLKQIQSSVYLSGILARHSDLKDYASGQKSVDEALLQAQIDALASCDRFLLEKTDECSEHLRETKQRFSLLWSLADLAGTIEFTALGRLQSQFAERSIQFALELSWRSKQISRYFINSDDSPASTSGIFVLALGKLGGCDLNFSSDVDLIAFYDKSRVKVAPMHGASYAVTECLKFLSKVLSENTDLGFVWRVDWRLRPHASLRNLSLVSEKALDFYHYHARPWHRLAMIKARPVAGNSDLAQAFLSDLNPFLWRHNLDYRAIDDIAMLKNKINLEHPALVQQRAQEEVALNQGRGMNLKLGHGGIREIEFIVNARQLLWGGRKPALRVTNTLQALAALREESLLDEQDAHALGQAYRFLRQAENRLQMRTNAQDYHLPVGNTELEQFLNLCGETDWESFNHTLSGHRVKVHELFEALFRDENTHRLNQAITREWQPDRLSQAAQDIVQGWQDGFTGYGLAQGHAQQFIPLLNALVQEVENSGCEISDAITQIDDYFRRLPPGGQYFRLLRDFPWLLEKLIAPVLLSPTMMVLLQQSPHIIDRFLEYQSTADTELDTTIVFSSSDYEYRLANLRRLANEELYMRYSSYFEGNTGVAVFHEQLTQLAEQLLSAAVRVACDEMQLETSPVAIIGFGKLGSQGMMPKSDLDLVYLCDSMENHALASQFASKLNTIINSPMREGRVYELDTRLRPSGQSGSVTISLNSYRQHQLQRAHTWSHLALVSARFVAGNKSIGEQFPGIKTEILSRPRDIQQFKHDCAKMLKRVRDQRIVTAEPDQFTAKFRPGGLFELEYILSCMAVLECVDSPGLASLEYDQRVDQLAGRYGEGLLQALQCLRTLQLEIRLFGHDEMRYGELPEPILEHILNTMRCHDTKALIEKVERALTISSSLVDEFFGDLDWPDLADWKETRATWL